MGNIKMLKSKEDVKAFIEEAIEKDTAFKQERILATLMWLTYNSLQVEVWKN